MEIFKKIFVYFYSKSFSTLFIHIFYTNSEYNFDDDFVIFQKLLMPPEFHNLTKPASRPIKIQAIFNTIELCLSHPQSCEITQPSSAIKVRLLLS